MKKIVFNGKNISGEKIIGVGRYTYEIIKEFDKICGGYEVEVLIPFKSDVSFQFQNIKVVKYGGKKTRKLWEQIAFGTYIIKNHAIGINLDGNPPLLKPDITCKHDVTHLISRETYIGNSKKRKRAWYWHKMVDCSLKLFAPVIITVSNSSKEDIAQYYKINPDKIVVISNAWQHFRNLSCDMKIFDRFPMIKLENYYFGLGAQNKNKNFEWIISNAVLYPENQYVIAGKYISNFGQMPDYGKNKNIIFLGYVSDEELKALMSHCKAFLFPSFYEGFGIPPMEALSVGKDAVVSHSSCLPEIYEDAVYYIDPYDPQVDIDRLIAEKRIDESIKNRVLERYSWEKSAKQLMNLLKDLY